METVLGWLSMVPDVVLFLLGVGLFFVGPMVLVDRSRNRREEMAQHQILLTDAIYERFGSIASPVVKKRLWGPRQVHLAVQHGAVDKALMAAREVLSVADRMELGRYEIVLTPQQAPARKAQEPRANQPAARWSGDTKAAA